MKTDLSELANLGIDSTGSITEPKDFTREVKVIIVARAKLGQVWVTECYSGSDFDPIFIAKYWVISNFVNPL